MKKIVLVTTLNNAVSEYLEKRQDIVLNIVACNENYNTIGERLAKVVNEYSPDFIIAYRCPYIIPKPIYSKAIIGAYNIHPSLLPAYPGLNPWDDIFRNREVVGGVTLHKISDIVDMGEIVSQKSFYINHAESIDFARGEADVIAVELLDEFLNKVGL